MQDRESHGDSVPESCAVSVSWPAVLASSPAAAHGRVAISGRTRWVPPTAEWSRDPVARTFGAGEGRNPVGQVPTRPHRQAPSPEARRALSTSARCRSNHWQKAPSRGCSGRWRGPASTRASGGPPGKPPGRRGCCARGSSGPQGLNEQLLPDTLQLPPKLAVTLPPLHQRHDRQRPPPSRPYLEDLSGAAPGIEHAARVGTLRCLHHPPPW